LAFVPGTSPRFMLIGLSSQSFGVLASFSQRQDGAMTGLAANTLRAIGGDAFGTGQSSIIGVGDGGNGSFLVVAAYSVVVDGGVVYQGMANLRCK
jgi:hypothetical protein